MRTSYKVPFLCVTGLSKHISSLSYEDICFSAIRLFFLLFQSAKYIVHTVYKTQCVMGRGGSVGAKVTGS